MQLFIIFFLKKKKMQIYYNVNILMLISRFVLFSKISKTLEASEGFGPWNPRSYLGSLSYRLLLSPSLWKKFLEAYKYFSHHKPRPLCTILSYPRKLKTVVWDNDVLHGNKFSLNPLPLFKKYSGSAPI